MADDTAAQMPMGQTSTWTPPAGSWSCTGCQNINFPSRTTCNRCGLAPGGVDTSMSMNTVAQAFSTQTYGLPTPTATEPSGGKWTPPSGSWPCSNCQNINFPSRTSCNRCRTPRGSMMPNAFLQTPITGGPIQFAPSQASLATGRKSGFQPPVGSWICPNADCENINFPSRKSCNRCQTEQPGVGAGPAPPPPGRMKPGSWVCPNESCGNVNFPNRDRCNRCNALPPPTGHVPTILGPGMLGTTMPIAFPPISALTPRPPTTSGGKWVPPVGSWHCESCQNVNFPTRTQCNRCQAPKPQTTVASTGAIGASRYAPY
mmetsp:Transcript_59978/g.106965  ORF Transcript_59978/g.106965 Transcript_59978/m.106965 type:complete len:316 (-) Transcript_59978:707-1654(-)